MSIVYMPSERCPKCPLSELCKEERTCPILDETPVNLSDLKREVRLYTKIKPTRRIIPASRKGTSPLIAAVALVVVTIIVSVSIANWMGGIAGQYTGMEIIEISSASVSKDFFSGVYTISFSIKNIGSKDATINMIYVNGKPYNDPTFTDKIFVAESDGTWMARTLSDSLNILVRAGNSTTVVLKVVPASRTTTVAPFTTRTMLDISFRTSVSSYPKMIVLT